MSCGGTSAPRRKVGVGGCAVRWAQSRGEWPGERRTFLDWREEGDRVEVEREREREEVGVGGARRVEAVEGGGRRVVGSAGFRFAVAVGRGGGGIVGFGEGCGDVGDGFGFGFGREGASVAGLSLGALSFPLPASSSVNVGMAGLSLDPSPSYSSSSSLDVAVGGPALLFAGSCLPVHADGRAAWYLYAITETETSSTPSANSTIVRPDSATQCLYRYQARTIMVRIRFAKLSKLR